jgi:Core-2/I-Branching enzyme
MAIPGHFNAGNEFISITRMPDDAHLISRLDYYRARPMDTVVRLVTRLAKALRIKLKRDYAAVLDPLLPYGGDTWWALSASACAYILRFVDEHPRMVEFFKNTRCPDECFFQTILDNSSFKPHITSTLTYADWSRGGSSPQQIYEKHIAKFKAQSLFARDDRYRPGDVLFARKFCDDSGELVAAIDALKTEAEAERPPLPLCLAPHST